MPARPFHLLTGLCAALLAGCGGDAPRGLADAAAVYRANEAVFESIRGAHPGPYREFFRIPARDPAEARSQQNSFIKSLRRRIPVEYIDFFPIGGEGSGDEFDVVLNRYTEGDEWRTISVVYFSAPLTLDDNLPDVRLFDECGAKAAAWLQDGARQTPYAAFCRLNESWYAYQRVD
jgi:hypothetical protein